MSAAGQPAYPSAARGWSVVGILSLTTILSYIDRQLINLLVDPVRATLHLSDTQISLLQGPAFIIFYLLVGLPAGRLVDRGNRRTIIVVGLLLWSAMTLACGMADSFTELFIARAGVGIGEACLAPAAYSLVSDYFPPRLRGRAISLVVLSGPLGSGLSFILGGLMLGIFPGAAPVALPGLGTVYGWQLSFLAAGAPGFLVVLLLLLVREVPRQESAHAVASAAVLPFLRQRWRPLTHLLLAFGLLALSAYAVTAWKASFYIRTLQVPPSEAGLALGLLTIVGSISGGVLGGILSDRLAVARMTGGRLNVLPIAAGLAVPVLALWLLVENVTISFACLILVHGLFGVGTAATPSALHDIVPNRLRGQLVAVMTLVSGTIGAGLGPVSVALASDNLFAGDLRAALLTVTPLACLAACMIGWSGRRVFHEAVEAQR